MVIQDVVRGFSCVIFLIHYTEFTCPQKSHSQALLTEGWWVNISIKYTQTVEAQQRTSLFHHSKMSVYMQKKISFNSHSLALFLSTLYSFIFRAWAPLVLLVIISTPFWQGTGENIKNLRGVFSKTCHWLLHFTIQRLKIWSHLDDRVVEKFRLGVAWEKRKWSLVNN